MAVLLVAVLVAVPGTRVPAGAEDDPAALERACPSPLPGAGFTDVARGGAHTRAIDCLLAYGVTQGVSAERYGPTEQVTRQQMATFIARLVRGAGLELPAPDVGSFTDVSGTHADNIEALAAAGIVQGTTGSTFDPRSSVTRAQMATFILRSLQALGVDPPAAPADFVDVDSGVHAGSIGTLFALGVVRGTTGTTYAPQRDVTREQMASFLMRAADVLVGTGVTEPPYLSGDPDPAPAPAPETTPEACTAPPVLLADANELTAGTSRTYEFDVSAGQRISFRPIQGGSTPFSWRLTGPGGQVFDVSLQRQVHVLEHTGTYELEISSNSNQAYEFVVRDVTAPSCWLTAAPLPFAVGVNAPIAGLGDIAVPGDYHRFSFAVDDGRRISFHRTTGGSTPIGSRLFGPQGQVFDHAGSWVAEDLDAGNYRFEVYGRTTSTSTYGYVISDVTEPTLTLAMDGFPFTVGVNAPVDGAGRIVRPGEYQRFTFTVTEGQRLRFQRTAGGSTPIGSRLFGPEGQVFDHAGSMDVELSAGDYRYEMYSRATGTSVFGFVVSELD